MVIYLFSSKNPSDTINQAISSMLTDMDGICQILVDSAKQEMKLFQVVIHSQINAMIIIM